MGLFYLFFCLFLLLHRHIVCNDCNAVYSRMILFLWSIIECYQYSLWHYINLNIVLVSLNGTFVFWKYIVITDDKSALVRQMAWYRQATNHYLITWTSVDDASWRHIASLGLNRLTNSDLSNMAELPSFSPPASESTLQYRTSPSRQARMRPKIKAAPVYIYSIAIIGL